MWWFVAGFLGVGAWSGSPWVGVAGGVVAYLVAVQFHPWTGCWRCGESPKDRDGSGSNWRYCWVCGGKGRRRRVFARRER
ncbi:MAG: hypothetical protein JWO67_7401 [Streptosporangiaceae bacterium]|nr:hypothetical protein [Streptosporangiaceae bacterium]